MGTCLCVSEDRLPQPDCLGFFCFVLGFRVYIGAILGLYGGYIGIMEKKMETTV